MKYRSLRSCHFVYLSSTLRQGIHDLRVWPGVEADMNDPMKTPGKQGNSSDDVMDKLAKVLSRLKRSKFIVIAK